jgi:hypothetical protein
VTVSLVAEGLEGVEGAEEFCCDVLDPEDPCWFWGGDPPLGNVKLCLRDTLTGHLPEGAPSDGDGCINYYGVLDLKCPGFVFGDEDMCYRTMDTWLYCYEEDGETFWAFYGWLYPFSGSGSPEGCWIRKIGITQDSCDPLKLEFTIDPDDHNEDDIMEPCEFCTYTIVIEEAVPED